MAENTPTYAYRPPTAEEMDLIIARAKKLRSEAFIALCARSASRLHRMRRRVLGLLSSRAAKRAAGTGLSAARP